MFVDPSTGRWLEDLVSRIGREDGQIRLEDGDRLVQRPRHATRVRSQEDVRVPAGIEHPDVVHAGADLPAIRGRDAEPKRGEVHRSAGRRIAAFRGGNAEGIRWPGLSSRRTYDRKDGDGGEQVHRDYSSYGSRHDEEREASAHELFGRRPMVSIRQIAISAPRPKGLSDDPSAKVNTVLDVCEVSGWHECEFRSASSAASSRFRTTRGGSR